MPFKYQKRILSIFSSALKQAIVPALGLLFSLLITKKFSASLWGGITQITVWVSILLHIASWGNTNYLMKLFSTEPGKLKTAWQKCFVDRLPLLILLCGFVAIYLHNTLAELIIAWCLVNYVYQSYEPLINFHKRFLITVWAEVAGTLILFVLIYTNRTNLALPVLVGLCILSDLTKVCIVTILFFKDFFPLKIGMPNFNYYKSAFSFFLLGFIGLLHSRADLIYVTNYLSKQEIAFYQIITTFFSFITSGANMLILPFVPILYRLNKKTIYKMSALFTTIGIPATIIALTVVYFFVTSLYGFPVSLPFMCWGFLSIISAFYMYSIAIYLFKMHKQTKVVLYSAVGVIVNLVLCALLVPVYGTLGAIIAASVAQVSMVPLYLYEIGKITA